MIQNFLILAQETTETWWSEQLFGLDQNQRFVLLLVSVICITTVLITVIGVINITTNSFHRRRSESGLKRELIDRGMTVEDIAKIIESSPCEGFLSRWAKGQKE